MTKPLDGTAPSKASPTRRLRVLRRSGTGRRGYRNGQGRGAAYPLMIPGDVASLTTPAIMYCTPMAMTMNPMIPGQRSQPGLSITRYKCRADRRIRNTRQAHNQYRTRQSTLFQAIRRVCRIRRSAGKSTPVRTIAASPSGKRIYPAFVWLLLLLPG